MTTLNVLMLENNPDDALMLQRELRRAGYTPQITVVQTKADFVSQLNPDLDVILSDLVLPDYTAEQALDELLVRGIDVPFILVASGMPEDTGLHFVLRGAADYLLKDRLSRLGAAVRKAIDDRLARTERFQTAKALALSEQRFQHMFEVLPDVMLFINAADGTVLDANPAVSLLGYRPAELTGQNWSVLFPPDRMSLDTEIRLAAVRGETVIRTHVFRHRSGTLVTMDLTATLLESSDEGYRLLVTLRDATERMRADAERASAAQLNNQFEREKLLNEQRQRFINFAAHEFKNPLTAIRSSNATLQEYGSRMSEAARHKHHEQIEAQIQRMLDLIADMLTVGRLNEGATALHLQPVDLSIFARAMVEEVLTIYPGQPMRVESTPGNYAIHGDPKLFQRILGNLLSNAARYSPEKRPIVLSLSREGNIIVLRVIDNGIGIHPQDLATLFEPFKRGSNVGNISGTGLGLSIVKQSVELQGGTIEVESVLDKGTTFTIRMPAAR